MPLQIGLIKLFHIITKPQSNKTIMSLMIHEVQEPQKLEMTNQVSIKTPIFVKQNI